MSNTEPNLDKWYSHLDELSKLNKMGGWGNGGLEDDCYVCGISPSKHKEYIKTIIANQVAKARIEELELLSNLNSRCMDYAPHRIAELKRSKQ